MFYDEEHYFSLRIAANTYISKVFKYDGVEPVRNVTMVMEAMTRFCSARLKAQ
jgi:hypothetical protein